VGIIHGVITIAAQKVFELRHYFSEAATNGLGLAASQGTEVYSRLIIKKRA
jgi:hypothetical protein